jgi:hypothetical protein
MCTAVGQHGGVTVADGVVSWPSPAVSVPLPWDVSALVAALTSVDYTSLPLSAVHLWLLGVQKDVEQSLAMAFEHLLCSSVIDGLGFVPRLGTTSDARTYTTPLGGPVGETSEMVELCSWCGHATTVPCFALPFCCCPSSHTLLVNSCTRGHYLRVITGLGRMSRTRARRQRCQHWRWISTLSTSTTSRVYLHSCITLGPQSLSLLTKS